MTTITFFEPPSHPLKAPVKRVTGVFAKVAGRYREWQIRIDLKRDANKLAALDDRLLKDMGITRSEIHSIVYCGDNDNRRRRHEAG